MCYDIDHAVVVILKEALRICLDRGQGMIDVDIAEPALMRGDDDVGHRPERVIGRQRLLVEYVKHRPGNAPLCERLDQRRFVNNLATRQIDEIARRFHRREYRGIEAVSRGGRERR
jgi:hypothetical protein